MCRSLFDLGVETEGVDGETEVVVEVRVITGVEEEVPESSGNQRGVGH